MMNVNVVVCIIVFRFETFKLSSIILLGNEDLVGPSFFLSGNFFFTENCAGQEILV
jgi:hypothetical protein